MSAAATVAALILDDALGEPPEALHPTVWMGRAISALEPPALKLQTPAARRTAGICIAAGLPTLTYLLTRSVLGFIPQRLRTPLEVALFSTTLSMRGLAESALSVERELENGDLGSARAQVGTFVGRDTVSLSESEVVRAAVESVAENTSDGVAAPMFYGVLFGAPGALAYKAINTLDSM
ncbi:MAG: CobD/CbiB family cobalamin biosynthesis protein, partial [Rubrobacteraceae bacterium]